MTRIRNKGVSCVGVIDANGEDGGKGIKKRRGIRKIRII